MVTSGEEIEQRARSHQIGNLHHEVDRNCGNRDQSKRIHKEWFVGNATPYSRRQ
jgi:hypothetical protein